MFENFNGQQLLYFFFYNLGLDFPDFSFHAKSFRFHLDCNQYKFGAKFLLVCEIFRQITRKHEKKSLLLFFGWENNIFFAAANLD